MDKTEFLNADFKIGLPEQMPEIMLTPHIGVIGVGGGGGNAVNNMIQSGLSGVSFMVANTDAQSMTKSLTHERIQLGAGLTQGLGAGSNPEIGKKAGEESLDKIKESLEGLHMLFIACGMGGGTGTGASPVIAKLASEMGILTVGVVTKPFRLEGAKRMRVAEAGIVELKKYVDTLIVVPNQNLFRITQETTSLVEAFKMADDILYQSVKSITDLMMTPSFLNVDFADVRAVISQRGKAMMGIGEAEGENRAVLATEKAILNPLLDVSIDGAKGVLLNIAGASTLSLQEMDEVSECIRQKVDEDANIILGVGCDESLGQKIRVSVVATGLGENNNLSIEGENRVEKEEKTKSSLEQIITPILELENTDVNETIIDEKIKEEKENLDDSLILSVPNDKNVELKQIPDIGDEFILPSPVEYDVTEVLSEDNRDLVDTSVVEEKPVENSTPPEKIRRPFWSVGKKKKVENKENEDQIDFFEKDFEDVPTFLRDNNK